MIRFAPLFVLLCLPCSRALADAPAPKIAEAKAVHIYVVRRPLGEADLKQSLLNRNVLAHSAVLLKTDDGRHALLEYMDDSKVYVTEVNPKIEKEVKDDSYAVLKMQGTINGGKLQLFRWTRQLKGSKLDGSKTLSDLKKLMAEGMKEASYSIPKHTCHRGQERLRKALGLKVD